MRGYRAIDVSVYESQESMLSTITQCDSEGWRLVSAVRMTSASVESSGEFVRLIFVREGSSVIRAFPSATSVVPDYTKTVPMPTVVGGVHAQDPI